MNWLIDGFLNALCDFFELACIVAFALIATSPAWLFYLWFRWAVE